jgi:hypothetical protein
MRDFFHASSAELLKLRRTLALRLAILAPLIIVLLQLGIYFVRADEVAEREANPMLGYVQIIFTLWTVVFLPFYARLVASLLADLEHRGQNWSFLVAIASVPSGKEHWSSSQLLRQRDSAAEGDLSCGGLSNANNDSGRAGAERGNVRNKQADRLEPMGEEEAHIALDAAKRLLHLRRWRWRLA